jgi:DMSO/TMAO reductase YedYZ molybdopterin-dependent catalytic subunit
VVTAEPPNEETPAEALAYPITPSGAHYVRSHFAHPAIDARRHRIEVDGAVADCAAVTMHELCGLGERSVTVTLECAGNGRISMPPLAPGEPFDEGALSTATWTGTPLRALLERVGLRPGAVEILAQGADSGTPSGSSETMAYARALPREKALEPDTLLAWAMNGAALPVEHGGPVRLVVPGWYGMASVKWLSRLRALERPFAGWFQTTHYVLVQPDGTRRPLTTMRVKSRVVAPAQNERVPAGRLRVCGWAWSGAGPITRVDVALDGGERWVEAKLERPESAYAWTGFAVDLDVASRGRHTVRSRATDAAGNIQPETVEWNPLGYGNNAVRPVVFYL